MATFWVTDLNTTESKFLRGGNEEMDSNLCNNSNGLDSINSTNQPDFKW